MQRYVKQLHKTHRKSLVHRLPTTFWYDWRIGRGVTFPVCIIITLHVGILLPTSPFPVDTCKNACKNVCGRYNFLTSQVLCKTQCLATVNIFSWHNKYLYNSPSSMNPRKLIINVLNNERQLLQQKIARKIYL